MSKETRISGRGLGHRLKNVTEAHRAALDLHAQAVTDEIAKLAELLATPEPEPGDTDTDQDDT